MADGEKTNGINSHDSQRSTQNIESFGGSTRFEIELEFVQSLSNPLYLQHLAATKHLDDPSFIAYCAYLSEYWSRPEYIRYLQYPNPTLRALDLLQQESFRKAILAPATVEAMVREGFEAVVGGSISNASAANA